MGGSPKQHMGLTIVQHSHYPSKLWVIRESDEFSHQAF